MANLNSTHKDKYDRQLKLKGFGEKAQQLLSESSVLVVGAGGLGSPILQYLTATGVGRIGIVDSDIVEESNLHRQILFGIHDIGKGKAHVAKEKLESLNPDVEIEVFQTKLDSKNAFDILSRFDVIVDGSDNLPTRYLVNDACFLLEKGLVYGSVHEYEGQLSVFNHLQADGIRSSNYRDVFPTPPPLELVPNCNENGVLGVLPGIVGSMMASETIKIITGIGAPLINKILHIDILQNIHRTIKVSPLESNPISGSNPTIAALIDYEAFCSASNVPTISYVELNDNLESENVRLIDVRSSEEHFKSNIGGTNIALDSIESKRVDFSKDEFVVLYCKSGVRSAKAVELLQSHGFQKVYSLAGGVDSINAKVLNLDIPAMG